MILVLCGALLGQFGIFALESWQPELGQMMPEQDLRRVSSGVVHATASDNSTA